MSFLAGYHAVPNTPEAVLNYFDGSSDSDQIGDNLLTYPYIEVPNRWVTGKEPL